MLFFGRKFFTYSKHELGLYLSDLVFIAELPTFIESIDSDSDVSIDEKVQDNYLCERLHNNLVNYNKFRIAGNSLNSNLCKYITNLLKKKTIASVVKHVLAFQVLSRAYDFRLHADIYAQLQSMSLLDNSQIRNLSLLCEEQM